MKLLIGSLAAVLLAMGAATLQAGPVARAGNIYSNTYFFAYPASPAPIQITPTSRTNPTASQQTVQNAVATLNPQASNFPGGAKMTSSPVNVMQSSFYYNPYAYGSMFGYSGFYGGAVSYQRVFAVNNFGSAGPPPGSATSSAAFNSGIVMGRILTDPTASPEPGSIVLLASGVGALLFWRRRRQG